MSSYYEVEQENGEWFVFDRQQGFYVSRYLHIVADGFFTEEEAIATCNYLNSIHPEFLALIKSDSGG